MAEVVGAELELEAVDGARQRRDHHAGVVDEQVDIAVPAGGELADRGEAREVELADLGLAGHGRGGRLPLSRSRTARTTWAPAPASARAAARPMPLLAPVTITVRPVMSGMSVRLESSHDNNVVDDNNDVNDYIVR